MEYTARIVHGTTETTASGSDRPDAQFYLRKAHEWAEGRRDGSMGIKCRGELTTIRFEDIVSFAVDVTE